MFFLVVILVCVLGAVIGPYWVQYIKAGQLQAIDQFAIGEYLLGFPGRDRGMPEVTCHVTKDSFVFVGNMGQSLGTIPRDAINSVSLLDRSQITKHVTLGRMFLLGVAAFALPKEGKANDFYVTIDWDDNKGANYNTVFEFRGPGANGFANRAMTKLKQYLPAKATTLSAASTSTALSPTGRSPSLDDLEKLADLKRKGIITPEEFDAKKKQILGL